MTGNQPLVSALELSGATLYVGGAFAAVGGQTRQNLGAVGWELTPAQVARLDEASATTPAYPYWHQEGFVERNPLPV